MRSFGCEWMLSDENGGCTMCGHLAGTSQGSEISASLFIEQFDNIINQIDLKNIPMICIYNAGSFLNDNEMPREARSHIFNKLAGMDEIESIIFESRPEYIDSDKIFEMTSIISGKRIEIGIGLESSDEYVRQICLNKGFKVDEFKSAVSLLKAHGVHVLAYVLQKPPFLTEQQAIIDTTNSVRWAFSNGVDVVSIEPVSVQKNTLIHLLYNMKLYRPPWIWSVLTSVAEIGNIGAIRIGGFEFFPLPDVCTHNCSMCNDFCIQAIEQFNATNDIKVIEKTLATPCTTCKETWRRELCDNATIQDNIDSFLDVYDVKILRELLRTELRSYPNALLRIGGCGIHNL
jgi:radical SAM enzyme (TIGR01210 family)